MSNTQRNVTDGHEHDWADHTDLAVGEILMRTRCHYNLSLRDVEAALRIRAVHLTAIEEGRVDHLPGRAYAIGFVRTYAEYLSLDGEKIVHLFKKQLVGGVSKPEISMPVSASETKIPSRYVIAASCLALVALMSGLFMLSPGKDTHPIQDVPPLKTAARDMPMMNQFPDLDNMAVLLTQIEPASGSFFSRSLTNNNLESSASVMASQESEITITAREDAWLEIRDNEKKVLISRVLKPGETYIVPEGIGMVMDTGNIGVLDFAINNVQMPPLGAPGDIRRNVDLDPQSLHSYTVSAEDVSLETPQ
jgi:cytoskeleton protein RodZ